MRTIVLPVATRLLLLAVTVYSNGPNKAGCDYEAIEQFDTHALKNCIDKFKAHYGSEELGVRLAGERVQDLHDPHFSSEVTEAQSSAKKSPRSTPVEYGTAGSVKEKAQPISEEPKHDLVTDDEDATPNNLDHSSTTPTSGPEPEAPTSESKPVVNSSGMRETKPHQMVTSATTIDNSLLSFDGTTLKSSTASSLPVKKPVPNSAPAEVLMWRDKKAKDGQRSKVLPVGVPKSDPRAIMKKVAAEAAAAARNKTFLQPTGGKIAPKSEQEKESDAKIVKIENSQNVKEPITEYSSPSRIPNTKPQPSEHTYAAKKKVKKSEGMRSEKDAFGANESYGLAELFEEKDNDEKEHVVEAEKHDTTEHHIPQSSPEAELKELALRILDEVFVIQRYRLGYFRSVAVQLPFFSSEPIVTSDGVLVKVANEKNGSIEMIDYVNSCVYKAASGAFWAFDPVPPSKNSHVSAKPQWYRLTDEAITILVQYNSAIRSPEVTQKMKPPCFCHYGCERLTYAGSNAGLNYFRQAFIAKALETTRPNQPPLTWQLKIPAANKAKRLNKGGVAALSILPKSVPGLEDKGREIILRGTCFYALDVSGSENAHPQIWVLDNPPSSDTTTILSRKWVPLRADAGFLEQYWIWRWVQVLAGRMLSFPCHCQSCSKVNVVAKIPDGHGWSEYKVDGSSLPPSLSAEQKRLFVVDENIEQYWAHPSAQHLAIPSFKWERVDAKTVMSRRLANKSKTGANTQSTSTTHIVGMGRYIVSWEKIRLGFANGREWIRVQPDDGRMMVHEDDTKEWSVYPETCVYKFADEEVYAYNNPDYHYQVSRHGVGWKKLAPSAAKKIHENAAAIIESMQCRFLAEGEECEYDFQQCSNVLSTECYCERCCQLAIVGERQLSLGMVAPIGEVN